MTNNHENMPETYHIQKLKAVSVQLSAIGRADLAFTVLTNVEHLQSIIQNTRANDALAEENKRLRDVLIECQDTLNKASRQLTDDHKGVLYGKRWGEKTLINIDKALNQTKGSLDDPR